MHFVRQDGIFFLDQIEILLQISPAPHRSPFLNFLFQIVKGGNFAETLMYNTLCFTFASPEIQKKPGPTVQCSDADFNNLMPSSIISSGSDSDLKYLNAASQCSDTDLNILTAIYL